MDNRVNADEVFWIELTGSWVVMDLTFTRRSAHHRHHGLAVSSQTRGEGGADQAAGAGDGDGQGGGHTITLGGHGVSMRNPVSKWAQAPTKLPMVLTFSSSRVTCHVPSVAMSTAAG